MVSRHIQLNIYIYIYKYLNLRKKLVKYYIWSMALYGAETWTQQIRNTWKVLKCGAGEVWRRSVGPIM
jgi:hypothetical protein